MWRNRYQSNRGKFDAIATWPSKAEAEQRAVNFIHAISGERSAWAQSLRHLEAVEVTS